MALTRAYSLVFGLVYLVLGIAGFITTGFGGDSGTLVVFPLNALDNLIHLLLAVLALIAYQAGVQSSRFFGQVSALVMLVFGILGLISFNLGGFLPVGQGDVWLHLATALVGLLVGFGAAEVVARER